MDSIRTLKELKDSWDIFDDANIQFPLYGFFLYSTADEIIARYVREHWNEIDTLSKGILLFTLEKAPTSEQEKLKNRAYWQQKRHKLEATRTHDADNNIPYNVREVYKIAEYFSLIPADDLPCLVFFRDIASRDIISIPLRGNMTITALNVKMRRLFGALKLTDNDRGIRKNIIWEKLRGYAHRQQRARVIQYATDTIYVVLTATIANVIADQIKGK